MDITNGGYSQDKSGIEERLKQNTIEHERMEMQNNKDHQQIKDDITIIKEKYLQDVISLKTKVSGMLTTIVVLSGFVLTIIGKAIISWIEK